MAWALDQTSIFTPLAENIGGSTSVVVTTNVDIAAGATVFIGFGWFSNETAFFPASISATGLTGGTSPDLTVANGSDRAWLFSAQAASGLASGSNITINFSGTTTHSAQIIVGGSSFTGGATSSPLDTTSSNTQASTATWTGGTLTTTGSSDLLVGFSWTDGSSLAGTTDTPTSPWVEAWEANFATGGESATLIYQLNKAAGSYTPGGTWSVSNGALANVSAAYRAAVAAALAGTFSVSDPSATRIPGIH